MIKTCRFGQISAAFLAVLVFSFSAAAQEKCVAEQNALKEIAKQVSAQYEPQFKELSREAEARSKKIQDDNPQPSTPGMVLKFDVKLDWHDEVIILHLPSISMKPQRIAFDTPTITNTRRIEWSWSLPVVKTVQRCTQGIPETVCDGGAAPSCKVEGFSVSCSGGRLPTCSLRAGKEICGPVLDLTIETQSASMDVPEFAMKTTELIFDYPEYTYVENKWVLSVPDITVVNVEAQQKRAQDDSMALSKDMKEKSAAISNKFQAEIKLKTAEKLTAAMTCHENSIIAERDRNLANMDGQIKNLLKDASTAREKQNETLAKLLDDAVSQIIAARAKVVAEFEKALDQIRKSGTATLARNIRPAVLQ